MFQALSVTPSVSSLWDEAMFTSNGGHCRVSPSRARGNVLMGAVALQCCEVAEGALKAKTGPWRV